jgi:hypothetical protein
VSAGAHLEDQDGQQELQPGAADGGRKRLPFGELANGHIDYFFGSGGGNAHVGRRDGAGGLHPQATRGEVDGDDPILEEGHAEVSVDVHLGKHDQAARVDARRHRDRALHGHLRPRIEPEH